MQDEPPVGAKVSYAYGIDPKSLQEARAFASEVSKKSGISAAAKHLEMSARDLRSFYDSAVQITKTSKQALHDLYRAFNADEKKMVLNISQQVASHHLSSTLISSLGISPVWFVVACIVAGLGKAKAQSLGFTFHDGIPAGAADICRSTGFRDDCDPFYVTNGTSNALVQGTRESDYDYLFVGNKIDNDEARGYVYSHCMNKDVVEGLVENVLVNPTTPNPIDPTAPMCLADAGRWGVKVPRSTILGFSRSACDHFQSDFAEKANSCQSNWEAIKKGFEWTGYTLVGVVGVAAIGFGLRYGRDCLSERLARLNRNRGLASDVASSRGREQGVSLTDIGSNRGDIPSAVVVTLTTADAASSPGDVPSTSDGAPSAKTDVDSVKFTIKP